MPLVHKHKIINVAIPKTGGTFVTKTLGLPICFNKDILVGTFNNITYSHFTILEIKERINSKIFEDYYKISFVRNPWDKFVSEYFFLKHIINEKNIHKFAYLSGSFDDFVFALKDRYSQMKDYEHEYICHYIPQYKFLYDNNENLLIDFLGRFENINNDMMKILKMTNILNKKLLKINSSKHKHYSNYYNNLTKNIIGDLYSKDISLFNYNF